MINVYRSLLKAIYHSAEIRRIYDLTKSLIISRTQNLSFVSHKIHEIHKMVASYTRNWREAECHHPEVSTSVACALRVFREFRVRQENDRYVFVFC